MVTIPQSYNDKPLIHSWNYKAADGAIIGVVGRYQDDDSKKDIVPFFNRDGTTWSPGIKLSPRPLFGLDRLANHPKGNAVFIVEGEKAAAALQEFGICAVTSLGGSNAANQSDWTPLNGFSNVILWPDNDEPGSHYVQYVCKALLALDNPPVLRLITPEGLPPGGDAVDWLQSFIRNYDGYSPIDSTFHDPLKEELTIMLRKAKSVPENWGSVSSESGAFDWGSSVDIETKIPPVQALTNDLIPQPFLPWLSDVSHRMQTPPDFAVVSTIVICGSLIGSACGIRPKRQDDWEVISNIWAACIGRPSVVLKSPSMKEPMQLVERLQAEYGTEFENAKLEAEFDELANKAFLDDIKKEISKKARGNGRDHVVNSDDIAQLKNSFLEVNQQSAPESVRRLLKTNETSVQSMTLLQKQNPRGVLVFRDELTALLVRWDRDDCQDERAYFLEGWNGNGSYTDVKIGRGITDAPNICISLLGGIQPDKLKRYLYQAMQGNNDGLIQRLQLAVWPDEPNAWELIDRIPDKNAKDQAYKIIQRLAEMDFVQYGATKSEYDERAYFRFDSTAQEIFNKWLTELQTVKLKHEDNPLMVEHFGKFRSLMPSLALIFHCIDIANDEVARNCISSTSAQLAVNWCKYLESHARRIYAMAESPEHEASVRLTEKIKSKSLPNPFTTRDIERKGWHGLRDKQEIDAACNILINENWLMVIRKPKPTTGRPPLPEYHINPSFL